jgi:multiple sugar transport system substrate-binding protein
MSVWDNAWGQLNNLYTWGWAFGGAFYDVVSDTATLTDPQVVKALEWLADHYNRYVMTLAGKNPSFVRRFIDEDEVMITAHTEVIGEVLNFNPENKLTLGIMPHEAGVGPENPAWVGGWRIVLVEGSQYTEEAWKLIRFLAADPVGTGVFG